MSKGMRFLTVAKKLYPEINGGSLQPLFLSYGSANQPGLFPQADPSAVCFWLSNLPFISLLAVGLSTVCHMYTQLASWYSAEQLWNETSPSDDASFVLSMYHWLYKWGCGACRVMRGGRVWAEFQDALYPDFVTDTIISLSIATHTLLHSRSPRVEVTKRDANGFLSERCGCELFLLRDVPDTHSLCSLTDPVLPMLQCSWQLNWKRLLIHSGTFRHTAKMLQWAMIYCGCNFRELKSATVWKG